MLANQYEITDEAAVEFSRAFYEAVADGLPLDAAVAGARISLKIELGDTLEWGTPVLYMRSPDGRIFDVQEEDSLSRYRERVESAWVDRELHEREVEWLNDYANNDLGLSPSAAAEIEREAMGDTKEAILERQNGDREEQERRNRLDELYARARRSYRAQEWQAVVDAFDQIHEVDPACPDSEGLLASAREELEQARRVAAIREQGLRHMEDEEWSKALGCFEEVQRLEPVYPEIETLLSRVRRENSKPGFLPGERKSKPDFLPGEQKPRLDRPQGLPD